MSSAQPYRPWGELDWALGLSERKSWHFLGCLGTEERSVASVPRLHSKGMLEHVHLMRIRDTNPTEPEAEELAIKARLQTCIAAGISFTQHEFTLQAPLNANTWPTGFNFSGKGNVCIDISSLPKRFFFPAIRAALLAHDVRNLIVLYAKPASYPSTDISSNPDGWTTMDNFGIIDPDIEAVTGRIKTSHQRANQNQPV